MFLSVSRHNSWKVFLSSRVAFTVQFCNFCLTREMNHEPSPCQTHKRRIVHSSLCCRIERLRQCYEGVNTIQAVGSVLI